MLFCSYVRTQLRAEFRTISYMSGPSQKNLLASFLNWMPKSGSAGIFSGKAKQKKNGRNFSHHFLIPLSLVSDRGSVRRGKQTGRSFHFPTLDFRAPWGMFLHCLGIKSCCSDSLVTGFPVVRHSCPGLLSSYSKGDLRCGNKGCFGTPFPFHCF